MAKESSTYTRFRQNLASQFDRINRVENPACPGMPDVNCCFLNIGEFWVEIKSPKEPARSLTPLFGSNHQALPQQINWHMHQHQCGGRSFFLIDTDKRLMLLRGNCAETINKMTLNDVIHHALFCEIKPMRRELWTQLRKSFAL